MEVRACPRLPEHVCMEVRACPRLPEHVCMEVRVLGYLSMCAWRCVS